MLETAHEQPRADDHDDGECRLHDKQREPRSRLVNATIARALLERRRQVRAPCLPGGNETGEYPREKELPPWRMRGP